MNSYVKELVHLYSQHRNTEYAEWSRSYLRNQFEFLGIRAPIRQALTKQFIKEHGLPEKDILKDIILSLWNLEEREYQKAALDILEKQRRSLCPDDMPWLTDLVLTKSWWDTVDVLSPHIMGYMFSTYPELIAQYAEKWIEDNNIWLQRAAILYQLYYKDKTDQERLFRYILRQADSDEFFVQKAIGWALRQYAKKEPARVKSFVFENQLKPLSRREALKHLS